LGNDSLPGADDLLAELEPAFDPHSIDGRCLPPNLSSLPPPRALH
jgi:hypothetical protein